MHYFYFSKGNFDKGFVMKNKGSEPTKKYSKDDLTKWSSLQSFFWQVLLIE